MEQLPIFLHIKDRKIIVAGDGFGAIRRAEQVIKAGAKVQIFSQNPSTQMIDFAESIGIQLQDKAVTGDDLAGAALLFAADCDEGENKRLAELASDQDVPVNIMDRLALCTFVMPSIVDRSPLIMAISSGGGAPILSRMLRARLEAFIPSGFGRLAEFAKSVRGQVKQAIPDATLRRRFWEQQTQGPVSEYVLSGRDDDARKLLLNILDDHKANDEVAAKGEVYLVGGGPGDPDLLTFRALRLMQQADVVLHDRLVSEPVLNLVRREAERVFVGKKQGDHALPQEQISQLLVTLAKQGKRVLRLKGGDPFTFGRGGEEIEELMSADIPFQVVPGITAGSGCATYAGIPLTHRDHAQSCVFVTGHTKNGHLDLNWQTLVQPNQTVVVYMGLSAVGELTRELVNHGADPDTPACVVDNGTRENQHVVTATLSTLSGQVEAANLPGPAITIIGGVVTMQDRLNWFK